MEHDTKGVKTLLEDEWIIGLYTLCLSSTTARPLDGVGVPRKAYNSFIFQQTFEALGVIFHPPPQNEQDRIGCALMVQTNTLELTFLLNLQ